MEFTVMRVKSKTPYKKHPDFDWVFDCLKDLHKEGVVSTETIEKIRAVERAIAKNDFSGITIDANNVGGIDPFSYTSKRELFAVIYLGLDEGEAAAGGGWRDMCLSCFAPEYTELLDRIIEKSPKQA